MFEGIKRWWKRGKRDPFTVICDRSPFPWRRDELFHCAGRWKAQSIAYNWVDDHPYGKASITAGHVTHTDGSVR